ncbi:MAG TPA: hypothetical protein VIH93_08455 [Thermoanaerobaculia bacterium]
MNFETIGAAVRRGTVWVLKAVAAVFTFVVVYRLTAAADRSIHQQTTGLSPILGLAVFAWWVKGRILLYRPQQRRVLLESFARVRVGSPEFTAASLRHFRRRSRVLEVAATLTFLLACCGLIFSFADAGPRDLIAVLGLLFILVDGLLGLRAEAAGLSRLAGVAASSDEAARWKVVRSSALDAASADPVSRAIWRRIEPEKTAPAVAGSPEASPSVA